MRSPAAVIADRRDVSSRRVQSRPRKCRGGLFLALRAGPAVQRELTEFGNLLIGPHLEMTFVAGPANVI